MQYAINKYIGILKALYLLAITFILLFMSHTLIASSVTISAEFQADYKKPNNVVFTNTTPISGVCSGTHYNTCVANGWWSIDTGIRGTKQGGGSEVAGTRRKAMYVGMPGPRTVEIRHATSGKVHLLKFFITGAALRYTDDAGAGGNVTDRDNSPLGQCTYGITGFQENTSMRMFLRNDNGSGNSVNCSTSWLRNAEMALRPFDFVYRLETPNPYELEPGKYYGSTTYTVGSLGSHFDLGDDISLADSIIEVNFDITVTHLFQLFIPIPKTVSLQPATGWKHWISDGIAPQQLKGEYPFGLVSSTAGKVTMSCQYNVDGKCAISSMDNLEQYPLDVFITIPMFYAENGRALTYYPLLPNRTIVFSPENKDGVFHAVSAFNFEVQREPLSRMLASSYKEFSGNITFVFDSDLD